MIAMNVLIDKSKAVGEIAAPPSKSLAHRYLICAALSKGVSVISNVDFSEDIKATIDCIKALGAKVTIEDDKVYVEGIDFENIPDELTFMCRESGSTMRFFIGIAMIFGKPSKFYGSTTLRNRPFGIYEDICRLKQICFERNEDHIFVNGKLTSGVFEIAGNISSQFITGLMYALPLIDGDSVIKLIPPVESRSYIDLTIQALKAYGIDADWADDTTLKIAGNQSYRAKDIRVEGDCSNAAFLEAFNYLCASERNVAVSDVNPKTLQGDRVYKDLFDKLSESDFTGSIDISDCPDLGPVLFAVAAANHGGHFTGTRRLKIKESDRGTVMCQELEKFGIKSSISENDIEIFDGELCKPTELLRGHNDHRIVMSLSLLASITGGEIDEAHAVTKSYPGFFDDIKKLGIKVTTKE